MKKSVQEWFHQLVNQLREPWTRYSYTFGEANRIIRKIHALEPHKLPHAVRLAMARELLGVLDEYYAVWPVEATMLAVTLIDRKWHARNHANPAHRTSPVYKELRKYKSRVIDGSHSQMLIYNKSQMLEKQKADRYAKRQARRIQANENFDRPSDEVLHDLFSSSGAEFDF